LIDSETGFLLSVFIYKISPKQKFNRWFNAFIKQCIQSRGSCYLLDTLLALWGGHYSIGSLKPKLLAAIFSKELMKLKESNISISGVPPESLKRKIL
jgi:hypothetical protein